MKSTFVLKLVAMSTVVAVTGLGTTHAQLGGDGIMPYGGVAVSGATVFGTASDGGANGDGTFWSFDTNTDTFTKLHDFSGVADGSFPRGDVAVSGTTVFGTAPRGGANPCVSFTFRCGTLWSFDTSTDTFTKLHDFSEDADGGGPGGVAVSGTTVFGTAFDGGANPCGTFEGVGCGTLWSFDTSTDTFTKLHDFSEDAGGGPGGVAVSGTTVFGTASVAGANGEGTLWSFDTNTDTFTKLHDFSEGADGRLPDGRVAVSGTTVFGPAKRGGANGEGTLWSFDTNTDTFTKLHDFSGVADGRFPSGVALSGTTVFGTAQLGGANGYGTFWSFDTNTDTFTKLHDFSEGADGRTPTGGVAVSGTTVFGTAWLGGANGDGTLWSFDTSTNTFTNLHDFGVAEPSTAICGDFDGDGDVDIRDRTILVSNWTGALAPGDPGGGKTFEQGDCDGDGDVDTADQTGTIQNWTVAIAGNVEDGDDADLVFDRATGNVTLDASDTAGSNILSFVLGTDQDNLTTEKLTELNQGQGPTIDLGNIFPAGIASMPEQLADYLSFAEYASDLDASGKLDLQIVPEPSGLVLVLFGLLGSTLRRRRK